MKIGGVCLSLVSLGFLSTVIATPGNGSSCAVSLKPLPSDPAAQSGIYSLLLTSTVDASMEYLCSSGSSYDPTGITCYALQCPAPISYGPYGSQPYGGLAGSGYGGPQGRYGAGPPIAVGPQVAYVETAHSCWKLKQIRLNTYVYLICFVKGHPSTLYQVVFKENGLDLVNYDTIPYHQLTAVGRGSFAAENQFLCVAAVYSSYGPSYARNDHVYTHPTDQLAPVYIICPNNYKWYFCGNVQIKDTLDVSVWYAQSALHAIFVALRQQATCNSANSTLTHCSHTPLVQYTISPDIDHYTCSSRKETEIESIGPIPAEAGANNLYILRGIQTCTIVANNNATLICCAVDLERHCPSDPSTALPYTSFCIPYDTNSNRFLVERVVFLSGSDHATDIQLTRAHGECCQFIMTNGPGQFLQFYSLQSIISNLNNLSNADPVAVSPADVGTEGLLNSAVTCSTKAKCCGTAQTCITCTRPAKYVDKYLAELSCPSAVPVVSYGAGYDDASYGSGILQQQRGQYNAGSQPGSPYGGRPTNYSNPIVGYGGQPQGHGYLAGPVPYQGAPQTIPGPAQPYQGAPYQQNPPLYGMRYN